MQEKWQKAQYEAFRACVKERAEREEKKKSVLLAWWEDPSEEEEPELVRYIDEEIVTKFLKDMSDYIAPIYWESEDATFNESIDSSALAGRFFELLSWVKDHVKNHERNS